MRRRGHTEAGLTAQLAALGLAPGSALLVHASMRSVGPVTAGPNPPHDRGTGGGSGTGPDGGAAAVVRALRRVLGPAGTVVVPSFTPENSDTSTAYLRRIRGMDPRQAAELRATMPPFDPDRTPAPGMGILSETVRRSPGALRSGHPQTSFAALGPAADKVLSGHRPDCHLGEDSPLARLYELDAPVLLLGVGFDRCSAFHLAEYRVPAAPRRRYRCVTAPDGVRRWWEYEDAVLDDSDFGALGADLARAHPELVRSGPVGAAAARLLPLRAAVDFSVDWLPRNRSYGSPGDGARVDRAASDEGPGPGPADR
ncbi:AAC(3) family N-acetyltransferase [Streptomyces sp. NPDC097619]|uniref:aminoglycoside N(3)-acetyltransferase n=1 Tax=Streptomyces sp. NPDC097619 TaxID=3157228 RepID=UPI00331F7CEE